MGRVILSLGEQHMGKLSKTARASMLAGEGVAKRTPVAWVFEHKVGKFQSKPYMTCFRKEDATALVESDPERFFLVLFEEKRR